MKKIKHFEDNKNFYCGACGNKSKTKSTIRIWSTDGTHLYKTSKRPMVNALSLKLCPKCFKKTWAKITNIYVNS
jgi:ribosomal protein L31